ncbi:MAG: hypothetical protein JWO58_2427 [Chitinophagaceae bacterium]|nr:hypothetical protein [Chitinophagaceae bacterium]
MKLLLFLILLPAVSVAQYGYGAPLIPSIRTRDYYIELAPYWQATQPNEGDTLVILMSPYGTARDKFRENITLSIRNIYDNQTKDLFDYAHYLGEEFKKNDPSAVLMEDKLKKDRNDQQYWFLTFQVQFNNITLIIEQRYYLKNHRIFILSFCHQNKGDRYNTWLGNQIMKSFYMM